MKREARDFRETAPRPVKRIELDIKNPRLRLFLVIAALAVAAGAFYYGINGLFSVEPGWTLLEADSGSGITVNADFQLRVELGAGSETPLSEKRRLTAVYTAAARDAYTLYLTSEEIEDVHNIWYINHHPGEEVEVDARLYRAMEKSLSAGSWLYLGPIYEVWDSVYFSQEDREAAVSDPRTDSDLAGYVEQAMRFIRSGDIRLELRGGNRVCLVISDAFRAFGEEYGIERWIDFGWQKNAFIADDMADALTAAGWTKALLSSRDGFIRCLDERGSFTLNLYAETGTGVQLVAQAEYSGPAALMMLMPEPGGERRYSYRYKDGAIRTAWISPKTGLDVRSSDGLAACTDRGGCADLLCSLLDSITQEDTGDAEWQAAAGDNCALWLARQGNLVSLGSDLLDIRPADQE